MSRTGMKPRKLALSPTQNAIIWLLEEAGEEDLRAIKASVKVGKEELAREIAALERIPFVQLRVTNGWPGLLLTTLGRAALTT
jgi:hypothetical protein